MKWHALQAPADAGYAPPRRALWIGAGLTLLLHVGILVLFRYGDRANSADDAHDPEAFVIETELLRWGEVEPDETSLPTIANPRPGQGEANVDELPEETQEAPTETVDLNPSPSDAAEDLPTERRPEEKEQSKDVPQAADRGKTNPHRPTNDLPIEGFGDGYRSGTSLSPSAQRNMLARIQEQLQGAFSPPRSLSDEQLQRLSIRFHVRIAKDGQVIGWEVLESSGNRQFDTAAAMTLNRFKNGSSRLEMDSITDADFRALVEAKGLPIVMVGQ